MQNFDRWGALASFLFILIVPRAAIAITDTVEVDRLFSLSEQARERVGSGAAAEVGIDSTALRALAGARRANLRNVPLADGTTESFTLEAFSPFTMDVQFLEFDGKARRALPIPDVVTFQGRSESDPNGWMFLSVTNGSSVRVVVGREQAVVSLIGRPSRGRDSAHQIFGPGAIDDARPEHLCEGSPLEHARSRGASGAASAPRANTRANDEIYRVRLLIDVGNNLLNGPFGGSSSAATTYVAELIAAVSAVYQRDLKIVPTLNQVVVWTTTEPFAGGSTIAQLSAYSTYNQTRPEFRDLAHYLDYNPGFGGLAYLEALCEQGFDSAVSNIHGSYTFPVTSYVWDVNVVAHEMGHNVGSIHTHCFVPPIDHCYNLDGGCYAGPVEPSIGETMSYCHISGSVEIGFRGRVGERIRDYVEPASFCLANMGEKVPDCGDGIVDPGEECDDGDADDGDCCSSACLLLSAGVVTCDDGLFCTEDYDCADSSCYYQPVSCDDANSCTIDFCDEAASSCGHHDRTGNCDDGLFCTGPDFCSAGACVTSPLVCDDQNVCTADSCDEGANACVFGGVPPSMTCDTAQSSTLLIKQAADSSLVWKWSKGPLTLRSEFGDPITDFTQDYALCLYDENDQLVGTEMIAAANSCDARPCWKAAGAKGLKFSDPHASGITAVSLKAGEAGKSKVSSKGKGALLDIPSLPIGPTGSVRVQLRRSAGPECWESVFTPPFKKNDGAVFSDKE